MDPNEADREIRALHSEAMSLQKSGDRAAALSKLREVKAVRRNSQLLAMGLSPTLQGSSSVGSEEPGG
eukprot:CAMPEP_0182478820 /NCGR_PEP_ID=MMETSP1319-20130603/33102_1 /TAXON_ID=172717 /ORGANISM="Bolidomonas pacifica, Strain RCC208" /LENGTH=67 /DNA_ID=CAMNT_0024680189 /DNA_START=190 /DNA_END=390 /DNA_ORIENTATION=-